MRRDVRIFIIGVVILVFLSTFLYHHLPIKGYYGPPGMDDIFDGKGHGKDGWKDAFNHTHNGNWNDWMENWQDKYNKTSNEFKEKWRNVNHEFRKAAKRHAFIGSLSYENGYCVGNFIKFLFNNTDIVDYTLIRNENITVFNFIHIDGFEPISDPIIHGVVWRVNGENASIEIHDNPIALLKIKTWKSPQRITFYPNDNINVTLRNNNSITLKGLINGTIILASKGEIEVSNTSINVTVEESRGCILFLAQPYMNNSVYLQNHHRYEDRIWNHIAKKKVFARILVDDENKTDEMVFLNGSATCIASKNHVRIEINATGEGKTIVIDLSNRIFNVSKIKVMIDGENISSEDYNDILNETGGIPKYAVINGSNGLLTIVYIPHFSDHTIEISTASAEASIPETPGFELIILLSAIFIILSMRRKH
ncbi:MAG: hypothetical protein DRN12_06755 [Thermoplasmata archaeon]|nr:MAG: hypothetical protein DRN12_06755 [Thermoplasmata archaeon]